MTLLSLADPRRDLLEALAEPALLIGSGKVLAANDPARTLLGPQIEDFDVRLAIRQPLALDHILAARVGDFDVAGIGAPGRPWTVSVRSLGADLLLVRLVDRAAARAAEKMRVDFVANASHELRTPLTTILGYAETLAHEADLDAAVCSQFGGIISTEAKRMLRIIEDLMSLSRIEADRFVAPSDRVQLGEVAQAVALNARQLCDERGCGVKLDVEPDVAAVTGDAPQLMQMLDNLVSNAIRYGCTEKDCTVTIRIRNSGKQVTLLVEDNGVGIARHHLTRLTQRFYRVDEARSRHTGGTGLGLAIVKHIVERHRGRLTIDSRVGAGTKVEVLLPQAES